MSIRRDMIERSQSYKILQWVYGKYKYRHKENDQIKKLSARARGRLMLRLKARLPSGVGNYRLRKLLYCGIKWVDGLPKNDRMTCYCPCSEVQAFEETGAKICTGLHETRISS